MDLISYTKAEIDSFNGIAITCYGETTNDLAIALQDGCKTCELRLKAKRLFLIMYAFASIAMDDNGMTQYNDVTPDGLANMIKYLQQNCNCAC